MKDQTIDYIIKSTWQAIARMYNEEATKYGATMATGYTLLSIDKEKGTPSTSLGPKMGMEATSLTRTLKMLEERELISKKRIHLTAEVYCSTLQKKAKKKGSFLKTLYCNSMKSSKNILQKNNSKIL